MREEYDFSNGTKNPYAAKLKKQITINLDVDTITYFKNQAAHSGIPYQTLINLYLKDCAENKKELKISWNRVASDVSKKAYRFILPEKGRGIC